MDTIVSIRMPRTLFEKLNTLSKDEHFLDISECIRSITRKRCLELTAPYAYELQQLRSELSNAMSHKEETQKKDQLVKDLRKILGELEGGKP